MATSAPTSLPVKETQVPAGIRMYNTTAATPTTGLHLDEFSAI